jgi:hypothetical protein
MMEQCEVTGCTTFGVSANQAGGLIKDCYVHDNSCPGGTIVNFGTVVTGCIFDTNTGASSDGLILNAAYSSGRSPIFNNVFYANGRDGIRNTGNYYGDCISDNIFVNNVGIGLNTTAMSPLRDSVFYHHNAYFGNGTARSGNNAGTGDVTLTGDPFVDAANGNFALNNTAGAGAACRAAGYPGTFPGGLTTGYSDIGPIQHQETASVSGGSYTFVG